MHVFENAKWIWIEKESKPDTYGEFYREFSWDGKPALFRLSCDSDYALFINGEFVESNQYGDYEWYKSYDELDITEYLQKGVNRLALLVWHFGVHSQRYIKAQAGLIFELQQGEQVCVESDENTLCRYSRAYKNGYQKIITNQLGFSFLYDANLEDNWINGELVGFQHSVCVEKHCRFIPRPNQKLVRLPIQKATVCEEVEKRLYVLDIGEETYGLLSLSLHSSTAQKITVCYGESLQFGRVRRVIDKRDFSVEYVAKAGDNAYTQPMLRLGCRYLQIESETPISLQTVGIIPQRYPVKRLPYQAKTERQQAVCDISVRALELCMMEHYVDTPWREQALYTMDSRNQILCGYYAFEGGNFAYVRSNLALMAQDRRDDGMISICFPCDPDARPIPSFALHYVLEVREYIEHSGDSSLGVETYEIILKTLKAFLARKENGLLPRYPAKYWNFHDWTPHGGDYDIQADALLNSLMVMALQNFQKICTLCQLPYPFDGEIEALSQAIYDAFYEKETGLIRLTKTDKVYMELANAYAVLTGIVKGDEAAYICEQLAGNELISTTLSYKTFKYDALLAVDKEKYRSVILADIMRNYGIMLDCDATATWETQQGEVDFDHAGSLCHGWTALPIYYFKTLQ